MVFSWTDATMEVKLPFQEGGAYFDRFVGRLACPSVFLYLLNLCYLQLENAA